jgi:mannose-6-phosphate isomerase-like protein (cupin superfamily)
MADFAGLFKPASLDPFYTPERLHVVEHMNAPQSEDVSLAECRVAPGVTTQLHSLTIAERYLIQSGRGLMELHGGDPFTVAPGDCVAIPPGCAQRIRNTGADELVFLCICTPRFKPESYVVLEDDSTPELEVA